MSGLHAHRGARDVARAVLRRVEQGDAFATLALGGELSASRLSPADRGFATELAYGVLRHRARLDRALAAQAPRGLNKLSTPVLVAMRLAAYQILVTRVPAHAAVDDAVSAVNAAAGEKVAGFANAVLRRVASSGEPAPPEDLLPRLEAVHSMPAWLGRRLIHAVGANDSEAAAAAFNRPAPVVLRVSSRPRPASDDPARGTILAERDALAARVAAERPGAQIVPSPVLPEALLIHHGGAPETLAAFQDGSCTVQDIAAQLVGRLLGAKAGERILDACAGVGGKSAHLQSLAGGGAEIHAADSSRRKLDLAEDSIRRLRLGNIRTIEADLTSPDAPLAPSYDRVLLDAPCSGLGVLRRHPEAKWRRSDADIASLAALQARLLFALAPRVRPGGILVYSVCTFTAEEGREQIARFLAGHKEFSLADPPPGIDFTPFLDDNRELVTWPHKHDADAFFAARMKRRT